MAKSELDQDLTRLEAGLKQLEAEYNMYFAGRLPKPPWETRARVAAQVKTLDRMHIQNTGDRSKLYRSVATNESDTLRAILKNFLEPRREPLPTNRLIVHFE